MFRLSIKSVYCFFLYVRLQFGTWTQVEQAEKLLNFDKEIHAYFMIRNK